MMDELIIKTKFMKKIVSNILEKKIKEYLDNDVKIFVKDLSLTFDDVSDKVSFHLNINGVTNSKVIDKLMIKAE